MRAAAAAVAALLCTACATEGVAPGVVKAATPEAPCDAGKAPRARTYPADTLTGQEDIYQLGVVLWADRLERRAYQREAEAFIAECARR